MELGKYKEAEADFDAAEHSVNPDDRVAATINRGRLLPEAGQTTRPPRRRSRRRSPAIPQSFAAMFGRAAARESLGRPRGGGRGLPVGRQAEPAERRGEPAPRALPRHAEASPTSGRRYLQRAVDLDPTGDTGAKARLLLEQLEETRRSRRAEFGRRLGPLISSPSRMSDARRRSARQARAFRLLREGHAAGSS